MSPNVRPPCYFFFIKNVKSGLSGAAETFQNQPMITSIAGNKAFVLECHQQAVAASNNTSESDLPLLRCVLHGSLLLKIPPHTATIIDAAQLHKTKLRYAG